MPSRVDHRPEGDPCQRAGCGKRADQHRSDHAPKGNPCRICGSPAMRHRVDHKPKGNPCETCGLPLENHRQRTRKKRTPEQNKKHRAYRKRVFLGIDGEGQGRDRHVYVYMAASSADGLKKYELIDFSWLKAWNGEAYEGYVRGLTTVQCLEFILSLPSGARIFAYSFNYDLTKILQDVDDGTLYLLFRPELRRTGKNVTRCVSWRGYQLNLQGTKFTVRRGNRCRTIWDVWKFFQGKFVSALTDWKVGTQHMRDQMTHMKDKRADFDREPPKMVMPYCLEECRCMAELSQKLIEAHEKAGLHLKSFYGAGSSASAMLDVMGIKDKIRDAPIEMKLALAMAFFGGRFENSRIGRVEGPVYSWDISSAYPYQLMFLPCLVHGKWELTRNRKRIDSARAALVHYGLGRSKVGTWGPFPFRTEDGSICFPIESGGGWVWRDEYVAGERLFGHVHFIEAWVCESNCDCQPFEKIAQYYLERLRIGKEGPGIVIKLGVNSNYGKLAQSIGNAIYRSWIWAGIITSGCRAQALDVLGLHRDWSNMLMVATDGIYTRELIEPPIPKNTGTWEAIDEKGQPVKKPLGGWEGKKIAKGIFLARPGIYFPLNPTDKEIKDVRGRGVGKSIVLQNWDKIVESWESHGLEQTASIANVSRFCGAKTSISRSGREGSYEYTRASGGKYEDGSELPSYGQWVTRRVEMSFHPMPKRAGVNEDGSLTVRRLNRKKESTPYSKALKSQDRRELEMATQEILEQPDADLSDYEEVES